MGAAFSVAPLPPYIFSLPQIFECRNLAVSHAAALVAGLGLPTSALLRASSLGVSVVVMIGSPFERFDSVPW